MTKFLDSTGLSYLWDKIKALLSTKADKVSDATDGNFAGLDSTGNLTDSGYKPSDFLTEHQHLPEYTIVKLGAAEQGYSSSYVLQKDGTQVGATINIPKDMVVSSGEVKTVTVANEPYQGAQVGDKYIDLTIANTAQNHIYIPVKDLVDVYTEGNGIDISNSNVVSVKIDTNNAHGLSVGADGVALATATASSAGAMSAEDKDKLDGLTDNIYHAGDNISIEESIPYGYTPLEYVYNSSSTYQNTGIRPTVDDVELEFEYRDSSSSVYQCLLGNMPTSNNPSHYGLGYFGSSDIWLSTKGTNISSGVNRVSGHRFYIKGVLRNGNGSIYAKDLTNGTEGQGSGTYTFSETSYNIEIFRRRHNSTYMPSGARVYKAAIKIKGATVLNYIPAKRNSDDVCGFWDTVSKTFVTATAGQWNAGPVSSWEKHFTINAINIPTSTSELTNDSGFITSADVPTNTSDLVNDGSDGNSTYVEADELAAVATTGNYSDLNGTPTIPTVNNATLTIKQGGTTKGTFTANASQDVEIDLDAGGGGGAGTLDTTNTTALTPSASESLGGSVSLHKVSKTGTYSDLIGAPQLPLSIANGGTGQTTAKAAEYAINGGMGGYTSTPTDSTDIIMKFNTPNATNGVFYYRKITLVWDYIKSKIASILGIGGSNGIPTAPTAAAGTNTTQIATTAFVNSATSGFAIDDEVVHKTGNENIAGTKGFTDGIIAIDSSLGIDSDDQYKHGVYFNIENYYDDGSYGVAVLSLDDPSGEGNVIVRGVSTPIQNNDAVNKQYVDELNQQAVSLNGRSGAYGLHQQSLAVCAESVSGMTWLMEPLTTSGGIGTKAVNESAKFPIGSKIYYHPDETAVSANTDFTSKMFYSSYGCVDARYSANNGGSVSLGSSSTSNVYLRVVASVSSSSWSVYSKGNIIVTSGNLVADNFYIYLGKTVGSTGYTFQLEDNNPLYYYDGTRLIDWAVYAADLLARKPPYKKFELGTLEVTSSTQNESPAFASTDNIEAGTYKVTLMRHITYDGSTLSGSSYGLNMVLSFKRDGSNLWTYIAGGTYVMNLITSPNDVQNRLGSVVVFLTGFLTLDTRTQMNDRINVAYDGPAGVVLGADQPIFGPNIEKVENKDFVLFEKI